MKLLLNLGPLAFCCIIVAFFNYRHEGNEALQAGLTYGEGGKRALVTSMISGGKFFLGILPMIALFAVLSGMITTLYKKDPETTRQMMTKNPLISAVSGAIIPGGISAGSVLQTEWKNGIGNKLAIITFLISTTLVNWNTLLFRLPFLGGRITVVIFGIGVVVTVVIVAVFMVIEKFK